MSLSLPSHRDVAVRPVTSWLDQVQLRHGPVAQLGRFLLVADKAAHDLGISLQLHTDMGELDTAYRSVQSDIPVSVAPQFDPAHSDVTPDNAFWISGHDESGTIVATQAARFFDLTQTSLEDELTSLRLFYAKPEPHLAIGTCCLVDCPTVDAIAGRVVYSGGAWYHRKIRGRGLSRILPRISRVLAYSRWNSDCTFSLVEDKLITKNVHQSYGYTRHARLVRLAACYKGDLDFELVWMPREEMLADLSDYVSTAVANDVRNTETAETNRLPPRRQGSSSLS